MLERCSSQVPSCKFSEASLEPSNPFPIEAKTAEHPLLPINDTTSNCSPDNKKSFQEGSWGVLQHCSTCRQPPRCLHPPAPPSQQVMGKWPGSGTYLQTTQKTSIASLRVGGHNLPHGEAGNTVTAQDLPTASMAGVHQSHHGSRHLLPWGGSPKGAAKGLKIICFISTPKFIYLKMEAAELVLSVSFST